MVAILGANSVSDSGYEISNSLRFNDNDTPMLSRTMSSGNRQIHTLSTWVKRSNLSTGNQRIFSSVSGSSDDFRFRFTSADILQFYDAHTGNSNTATLLVTTRVFRDPSAWYHLVAAVDTTQGTAANRVKIYVNGVQETSFSTAQYPSQNDNFGFGINNKTLEIGCFFNNGSIDQNVDGYVAEMYAVDGAQLTPDYFGKFDDNGVWIPVKEGTGDGGSITYGTNGFLLEFKETGTGTNASGIGADTSGNDNHFAPTNLAATDVTTDTPTNNFATLNPLQITNSDITLSEGNLKHTIVNNWKYTPANMAAQNGKWYAEVKAEDASNFVAGFMALGGDSDKTSVMNTNNTILGSAADGWGMVSPSYSNTGYKNSNSNSTAISGTTISNNDIVIFAMDLDNQKIYFGLNGTWNNSGNPANQTNPAFTNLTSGLFYTFVSGGENNTNNWNFGNPAFTISSGNADANGYGNFEYAPPSGFYSLCVKNLAQYG